MGVSESDVPKMQGFGVGEDAEMGIRFGEEATELNFRDVKI